MTHEVPHKVTYKDDGTLIDYGIGFTNIVSRTSKGTDDLSKEEMIDGAEDVLSKLEKYKPRIACFNGMGVWNSVLKYCEIDAKVSVGLQKDVQIARLKGIIIYVMPSSSGRVSQYSKQDKLELYKEMKILLDCLKKAD